eukprot:5787573-Amphidinium_carterae.1
MRNTIVVQRFQDDRADSLHQLNLASTRQKPTKFNDLESDAYYCVDQCGGKVLHLGEPPHAASLNNFKGAVSEKVDNIDGFQKSYARECQPPLSCETGGSTSCFSQEQTNWTAKKILKVEE